MLILFLLISFFFPRICSASSEFTVSQNFSYVVSENGSAKVSQNINLTNKISQIYAKEYQVTIHNTTLQAITGHDKHGSIIKSVTQDSDKITINLQFEHPVIGKDQQNNFTLEYSIPDFAQKKGSTWEMIFPVFDDDNTDSTLNINLSLPTSFGDLSFASVPIKNNHLVDNRTLIEFTSVNKKNKPLLIFGNNQLFDFQLLYSLNNTETVPISTEIAIPPDTNLQTITYKEFQPVPISIRADDDGNWLAKYQIEPSQTLDVTISGQAKIHPSSKREVDIDHNLYTRPQKYWETTASEISTISHSLKTPQSIYNYVVNTLNYDYSRINSAQRKGALQAINDPSKSLCTEFTDLFVTLSRSAGIPAREIEGFAYSNNPKIKPTNLGADILHAWPEYYNQNTKTWVQVDPTWEKTTNGIDFFQDLDLNHLTFVIHGLSSENPPPPGSYKRDQQSKSVFVDFATSTIEPTHQSPVLEINSGKLTIRNPNLYSLPPQTIKVSSLSWEATANNLPPLGSQAIDLPKLSFLESILPQNAQYKFEIVNNDNSTVKTVINRSHYLYLSISIGMTIFILCIGGIILTTVPKKK